MVVTLQLLAVGAAAAVAAAAVGVVAAAVAAVETYRSGLEGFAHQGQRHDR